jgi:cullin-4
MSKHNGRRLTWQHSLDTCVIRAEFLSGKKELAVSFYQALVLLLFDYEKDGLSYKEIAQSTNIGKIESHFVITLSMSPMAI